MNSNRMTATIVGVLYIIGTVAGILSVAFTKPILDAPDYLVEISADGTPIITGALFVLIMGFALAMIPVIMFPVSSKHNETLALGYLVFRGALETFTYMALVISWLLLLPLSQLYLRAASTEALNLQALGTLVLRAAEISANTTAIVFPLGALMFYWLLYRSTLIPRWISVWGLLAVTLHFVVTGLFGMFGLTGQMGAVQDVAALPIALQEMVMAVWFIVKGFNSSAIPSESWEAKVQKRSKEYAS